MSDTQALVFAVQRFCVHDGPGIRTVVFFKGCTLGCAWCQNPEAWGGAPELAYYAERCRSVPGCSLCVSACPEGALGREVDGRVDWSLCTDCGRCVERCPAQALERVGRETTVDELLAELDRDAPFFASSGGGVTFSGGEPVLHAEFLIALLPQLGARGISRFIETAGAYPFARLEPLLPHLDGVLFDIKHADSARHLALCGQGNGEILANLAELLRREVPVEVRMPVVPGLNDGANVEGTARLLRELGVEALTLLPYNHLWEAKLPRLRSEREPLGIAAQPPGFYADLERAFGACGVRARRASARISG